MKKLLLLAALAIFIACGKKDNSPAPPSPIIDSQLQPYYQNFKTDADRHNIKYGDPNIKFIKLASLSMAVLTPTTAMNMGHCYVFQSNIDGNYYKELILDAAFNAIESEVFKNKIFLHELGQCAYHLPNAPDDDINAIMHSPIQKSIADELEGLKQQFFDSAKANEANWNNTDPL